FQATLEETAQADLLLHVVDSASEDRDAQIEAVNQVLAEIGAADVPQILVWNKIDLTRAAAAVERGDCGTIRRIFLSARTGEGLELLRDALAEVARQTFGDNADRPAGSDDERRQET
ncbi:MAG: GTPase HflX, partial [Thauera sp.]